MKLIVGLGNPGEKYKNTRHNMGFMVVENLARKLGVESWEMSVKNKSLILRYSLPVPHDSLLLFAKPQTYMNDSGLAVSYLVNFYSINSSDLFVIHDDLDIAIGEYKIQIGKGPKEHNGILSIEEKLGTKDFWRVRVGIENEETRITDNGQRIAGEDYVLMKFLDNEKKIVDTVITKVTQELLSKFR